MERSARKLEFMRNAFDSLRVLVVQTFENEVIGDEFDLKKEAGVCYAVIIKQFK